MKRVMQWIVAALLAAAVAGCAGVKPDVYGGQTPPLDLSRYFNGTIDGWGMVQDRSGKVLRRFHVVIEARWNGDTGTLDESFDWSDGRKEKRLWTLRKGADGRYTGSAGDVVGEAAGVASGNALQWVYVLKLPEEQGGWQVNVDDWMYLVDENTLLNRSTIGKFGIRFADITIAFRKR